MKILLYSLAGLLAVSTVSVLACQHGSKQRVHSSGAPAVASPGKAVADIAVTHTLRGKAVAGDTVELELVFGTPGAGALDVSINAPAVLSLGQLQRRVVAGEPLLVTLVPQRDGRFYVNASVRRADGATRVVSIPVQVGDGGQLLSKAQRSANGELLVRMRAD